MKLLPANNRGHHPDSPSSLQSTSACAHFENLQRETAAAAAGTLQHHAAETRDLSMLTEQEQVDAVQRCIALEDRYINELKSDGLEVQVIREEYLAVCDEKVVAPDGTEWQGITGGYPDTLLLARRPEGSLAAVLDWKFGKVLVTPTASNLQGMAYALAVLQKYPDVQEVLVIFYHPHIEMDAHRPEYSHVFTRDDMGAMELTIRRIVAQKHEARKGGWGSEIAPVPSTELCVWCAKIGTCPAVQQLALVAHQKHEQLDLPVEVRPAYLTDPDSMRKVYQVSKVLETFAKSVRARITDAVATEGVVIPGMRLVTKTDRNITSVSKVAQIALGHGLSQAEFEACLSLPITKVETAIKSKYARGQGKAVIDDFRQMLEESGAVEEGRPYSYLMESKRAVDEIDV
jgi:hypothetical protein